MGPWSSGTGLKKSAEIVFIAWVKKVKSASLFPVVVPLNLCTRFGIFCNTCIKFVFEVPIDKFPKITKIVCETKESFFILHLYFKFFFSLKIASGNSTSTDD